MEEGVVNRIECICVCVCLVCVYEQGGSCALCVNLEEGLLQYVFFLSVGLN